MYRPITKFVTAVLLTASTLVAPPASAAERGTQNWDVKVTIDVDWKAVGNWLKKQGKAAWNTAVGDHPTTQQVVEVAGRAVVLVPVQNGGTERITNQHRLSDGLKSDRIRVLFANTGNVDPASLSAQEKHDEKWDSDPNVSDVFSHNQIVNLTRGGKNYFAGRSPGWAAGMMIVCADPELTPEQLASIPGVTIK